MAGGMHGEGMCGMSGRRDGHCSGRYASYFNALLFFLFSHSVSAQLIFKNAYTLDLLMHHIIHVTYHVTHCLIL